MSKFLKLIHCRFILMLLGTLGFSVAMAQNNDDDTQKNKSYFKASGSYLSNSTYFGRTDSLATPYLTPSISYFNKGGLFITASLSYPVKCRRKEG